MTSTKTLEGNRRRWNKHYDLHKDAFKEKRRMIRERDPAIGIIYRSRCRAKKLGIPFTLKVSDILIPAVCPVLGIPLVLHHGYRGYYPDSPSIDRIEPTLGYVPENIRMISARANLLKSDATVDELLRVLTDLKKLRGVSIAPIDV